jgi:hypothetical protein
MLFDDRRSIPTENEHYLNIEPESSKNNRKFKRIIPSNQLTTASQPIGGGSGKPAHGNGL